MGHSQLGVESEKERITRVLDQFQDFMAEITRRVEAVEQRLANLDTPPTPTE